ncbi:hypothetical protein [Microbacterium sp. GCS4]|uniref:hypothetical protein n=1 Tax=Microbacterium sp. GCS4 TaxID=1692239 RepID=UPI000683707D|nr:hypothetical protein [Microbacterium sp. GCS4]KNY07429.1 hypothetical protein AKH00_03920 [Microbacterium sp. GCS4]
MSDEQQPDVRWAPMEPKPRNRGRVWLIVGLVVAALVIVGVVLFFLLPRGDESAPGATATPKPSATATSTPTAEPTDSAEPTTPPVTAPPEPVDPTIEAFRGQVEAWLSDGARGLDIVASSTGQDALSAVTILQEDAQRLGGALPPSSIADQWRTAAEQYTQKLVDVRNAVSAPSDTTVSIAAAREALTELSALVGL